MTDNSESPFSFTQNNAAVTSLYFDPTTHFNEPKSGFDFKELSFPYSSDYFLTFLEKRKLIF
jgi:hypothetical protein